MISAMFSKTIEIYTKEVATLFKIYFACVLHAVCRLQPKQNCKMLNFLRQTRKFVNAKEPICIVLGNESCDLDSAVSAISLAYFFQNNKAHQNSHSSNYLPILNIPKRDYPLKTEVKYIFQKENINEELLTYKDELTDEFLESNKFILVDHHVSEYQERCVAIYDHRPKDANAKIAESCVLHLDLVGSCATLAAEALINAMMLSITDKVVLNLLRSTIILDTVNFSESAARGTPKDMEVCLVLEEALLKFGELQERAEVLETLIKARADVSSLNASQLLRKDFKIITSSKKENIKVALPGFPLPVQQYILKFNAEQAIQEFANEYSCSIVLLMGMFVNPQDNSVHRDCGIINIRDSNLCKSIKERILSLEEPPLHIEKFEDCSFMNGCFYKQHNIKVTRKHIIPIIKSVIDE